MDTLFYHQYQFGWNLSISEQFIYHSQMISGTLLLLPLSQLQQIKSRVYEVLLTHQQRCFPRRLSSSAKNFGSSPMQQQQQYS